jgi:phosphatidylserine/phosphatidylglycerophosphate/cardiolipin synthase-like enzyme
MNLGDRFRSWRDLVVRLDDVDALRAALAGQGASLAFPLPATTVVTNAPPRFDVRPALEALLAWPDLTKVDLAMAYLDRAGAALLAAALARGVKIDLTLPAKANVYHHANLRALWWLMARGGPLTARLVEGMLHAKALLLHDARGPRIAVVGSANLKRNSFVHFAEAVVVCTEPAVVEALAGVMDGLRAQATTVDRPPGYGRVRAWVEEAFG